MTVCASHHGTDGLLPVRSLPGVDMSQFRHNVVVLQVTCRPQAPKIHETQTLLTYYYNCALLIW